VPPNDSGCVGYNLFITLCIGEAKTFVMIKHLNGPDIISHLHEKGFANDFQMVGNDLFWVQENILIRAGEFSILEYHKVAGPKNHLDEFFVFGVIALYHNVKGILINHESGRSCPTPPVIRKKINEHRLHGGMN
jgi:hypothetical protein